MSELLRQYAEYACVFDGYPYEWGHSLVEPDGVTPQGPPIKDLIREQAGHRCLRCGHPYRKGEHGNGELSQCDEHCLHGPPWTIRWDENGGEHCFAHWRILTVHHLDEDKANCRWWNLAALCQRCHLRMQRAVVMGRPYHYEHSAWFRPFAAGFYAFKYLGEDLTREETMARLDELLALEHRWTQEALL